MATVTHEELRGYLQSLSSIRRLAIAPENPLYPTSSETLNLKSKQAVRPGVLEVSGGINARRWLIVDADGVKEVT